MKIALGVVVFLVVASVSLQAQTGCVDSPECPTAVLVLVGSAAVAVVARFRRA